MVCVVSDLHIGLFSSVQATRTIRRMLAADGMAVPRSWLCMWSTLAFIMGVSMLSACRRATAHKSAAIKYIRILSQRLGKDYCKHLGYRFSPFSFETVLCETLVTLKARQREQCSSRRE